MSHSTIAAAPSPAAELHNHARAALHQAREAKAEHRFATAECWYASAADAYFALHEHTKPHNPYRAAAWLAEADDAETSGYRARAAAEAGEQR